MNYARIMSRVLNQALLMQPTSLATFLSALTDRVGIDSLQLADGTVLDRDEMRAQAGSAAGRQQRLYEVSEGVAILPVVGTLVNKSGMARPYSGMTGYDSIEVRMWEALEDPEVNSILLDIDSGGGEVSGCFDLSDFINEANAIKPVWAFAGELAASAAYAVGSAADRLYLPRTGVVGSVGVVVAHQSYEDALEKAGVKVTLIHAGEKKVAGNPYEDLPDDVRADIQSRIDDTRQLFASRVAEYRGMDVQSVLDTEAGVFSGAEAVKVGFADGVANFNEVLSMLKDKSKAEVKVIGATAEVAADEDILEVVDLDEAAEIVAGEEAETALTTDTVTTTNMQVVVGEPTAMAATAVIEACDAAEMSTLALAMIGEGLDEQAVSERLTAAAEILDLCVAAGVEESEVLANIGNPVELTRVLLAQQEEAAIDSTHTGAEVSERKQTLSTREVWKHRHDESRNHH